MLGRNTWKRPKWKLTQFWMQSNASNFQTGWIACQLSKISENVAIFVFVIRVPKYFYETNVKSSIWLSSWCVLYVNREIPMRVFCRNWDFPLVDKIGSISWFFFFSFTSGSAKVPRTIRRVAIVTATHCSFYRYDVRYGVVTVEEEEEGGKRANLLATHAQRISVKRVGSNAVSNRGKSDWLWNLYYTAVEEHWGNISAHFQTPRPLFFLRPSISTTLKFLFTSKL